MRFIKKYWIELLILAIFLAVFVNGASPDLTWMNVDSDGPEYVMDAKYFYPAHHTSAPLYLLTGHLFLYLPFGTDYWKMSLMSSLFTAGAMVFIYLTVLELLKGNRRRRFYSILAGSIFGGAALVIAQAVVVETYAVVTMFSVGAYYFAIKKNWLMASCMLGMGLVTHHLILLTWLVLIVFHKEMRSWRRWGITFLFLIFYIYLPLSKAFTDQPNMWGNLTFTDFFTNNLSVFAMLVGKLSIWDFPKRIFDTFGILGISLGLALIPVIWWMVKLKTWKNELLWLVALPVAYYASDLAPQVAKYMEASIAWGAIIAVLFLSKYGIKWSIPVCLSAAALLGINGNYFDIGRTLDPNLAAAKFYNEEIPKMEDGDIFISTPAWEWILIFLYNAENDRHIIPVSVGTLPSPQYQNLLESQGVIFDRNIMASTLEGSGQSHDLNTKQVMLGVSIIENNPNVWTSKPTDPSVYGAEIVPAKGNEYQITRWAGSGDVTPQWQFKPSSPYSIITGDIEVTEWIFILQSSKNVMLLAECAIFPVFLYWLVVRGFRKKPETEEGEDGYRDKTQSET